MGSFFHLARTARGYHTTAYQSISDFVARVSGTLDSMVVYSGTVVNPALGLILAKTAVLVPAVAARRMGKRERGI